MATTTVQGTGGNAEISGFSAKLDYWMASLDFSPVRTTGFGDLGYHNSKGTLCSMDGSASGMLEFGAASDAPIPADALAATFGAASMKVTDLKLTMNAAVEYYMFDAVITNVSITRPEDGKADVTFDFASTGVIVQQ